MLERLDVVRVIDSVVGARRVDVGAWVGQYLALAALAALNRVVAPTSKLQFEHWWKTTVNRAAMGDPQCENHEFRIFDRVDDPIVADPDPPQEGITNERSYAARSRADAQGIDGFNDAARCRLVELGQLFESLGVVLDCVGPSFTHSPSARAASSAGTAAVRPAARSASRS
jgi:hypothetical protein